MADLSLPARDSVSAQAELFRRAARKGLTIAVLHQRDENLKVSTMRAWASGETAMPAWALGALGEAGVPDHLLSLVTQPFARAVVADEDGDAALDDLGREAARFTSDYVDRKADGKLCHVDRAELGRGAGRLRAVSSRVVRAGRAA